MKTQAQKVAEGIVLSPTVKELVEFGIPANLPQYSPDNRRFRVVPLRDTQDVAAAVNTETRFFNTATSDRDAHAMGKFGCSLLERGKTDPGREFFPFALQAKVLGAAATANAVQDRVDLMAYGRIKEFLIREKVLMRDVDLALLGSSQGATVPVVDATAAALTIPEVQHGQAGIGSEFGRRFFAFERMDLHMPAATQLEVVIQHHKVAGLNAAVNLQLTLWCVEVLPR